MPGLLDRQLLLMPSCNETGSLNFLVYTRWAGCGCSDHWVISAGILQQVLLLVCVVGHMCVIFIRLVPTRRNGRGHMSFYSELVLGWQSIMIGVRTGRA